MPLHKCSFLGLMHCSATPIDGELRAVVPAEQAPKRDAARMPKSMRWTNKPAGLWLGMGRAWLDLALGSYGPRFRRWFFGTAALNPRRMHIYSARISEARVAVWWGGAGKAPGFEDCAAGRHRGELLLLVDRDAVLRLHARYRASHLPHAPRDEVVDWTRVADHFAGVYVLPARHATPGDPLWYTTWEVPSACVWAPQALGLTLRALRAEETAATVRAAKLDWRAGAAE